MKLSIITINLNNRDGLQRTIDSVINQTFTDYEWVVIDGGSTDGSCELLKQNAYRFSYWISERDSGVYNAMNKGIVHSKGMYLQFLNSGDSLYEPTTLEKVFSDTHTADVIYGDTMLVKNGISQPIYCIHPSPMTLLYLVSGIINHQSAFFKRESVITNLYEERFSVTADLYLFMKLFLIGKKFEHIDIIIAFYDGNGISSNNLIIDKVLNERKMVIYELLGEVLAPELVEMANLKRIIKNDLIQMVIELLGTNRLFRNLIRLQLVILLKVNKCKKFIYSKT